jgi:hypothetical protein
MNQSTVRIPLVIIPAIIIPAKIIPARSYLPKSYLPKSYLLKSYVPKSYLPKSCLLISIPANIIPACNLVTLTFQSQAIETGVVDNDAVHPLVYEVYEVARLRLDVIPASIVG